VPQVGGRRLGEAALPTSSCHAQRRSSCVRSYVAQSMATRSARARTCASSGVCHSIGSKRERERAYTQTRARAHISVSEPRARECTCAVSCVRAHARRSLHVRPHARSAVLTQYLPDDREDSRRVNDEHAQPLLAAAPHPPRRPRARAADDALLHRRSHAAAHKAVRGRGRRSGRAQAVGYC